MSALIANMLLSHKRLVSISLFCSAFLCAGREVSSQVRIPDKPACATCTIQAQVIAKIGDFDGPGALVASPNSVRKDARGRYWVTAGGLPQVFDAAGKFIATIGRRGSGPGEFEGPVHVTIATPDSMLIIEPGVMRAAIYGLDFKLGRMVQLPGVMGSGISLRWPQLVILPGNAPSRDHVGWPLHAVTLASQQGEILRSGGTNGGQRRPNSPSLGVSLAPTTHEIWSKEYIENGYRLVHWSSELQPSQMFERLPPNWRRSPRGSLGNATTPPDHAVVDLDLDPRGLIWVVLLTPGPEWQKAWPPNPSGRELSEGEVRSDKLRQTEVEVIDPVKRAVVARARIPRTVTDALGNGLFAFYTLDPAGVPRITIERLSLVR